MITSLGAFQKTVLPSSQGVMQSSSLLPRSLWHNRNSTVTTESDCVQQWFSSSILSHASIYHDRLEFGESLDSLSSSRKNSEDVESDLVCVRLDSFSSDILRHIPSC